MALMFDRERHEYWIDGVLTPSTTQILRDSGLIRLDGVPEFILERARKRGSAVHELIHFSNEDDLDWSSVDEAYLPYLNAWMAYKTERQPRVLLCEYRIASRRHRVTGTLDLLCEIGDDGWILDYATGDPEDVSKDFQTASYLGLAMEWASEDPRLAQVLRRHARWRRAAVRLMRTGSFRVTEYDDPRDYARFQTLVAAWHIRNERGAIVQVDDVAA